MTSESKTRKKGSAAKQLGALAMVLGVIVAAISGAFTAPAALLFFGGLAALVVGIVQRDSDNS